MDPDKYSQYTQDGPKDADGRVDFSLSYVHLMKNCEDFKTEKMSLQDLASKIGVEVRSSPKYHAELAGEGIEYVWALTKNWFKRQPLSQRKTRGQFTALAEKALSTAMVTAKACRASSRRARSYILAYLYLEETGDEEAIKQKFDDIELAAKCF